MNRSFYRRLSRPMALATATSLACAMAFASPAPKDKEKDKDANKDQSQVVDSGSFGIFMSGKRVGTETFSINQERGGSVIKSEFKTTNAANGQEADQTSELQLSGTGQIRRYEWKELAPERVDSIVVPNDQFLTQKWNSGPQTKEQEQPYLLPLETNILDDYFFVHREVLLWKFLAASCSQKDGQTQCPTKQRQQFGTLDPRQHASAPMMAEFLGREKILYKGNAQELYKVELKNDAGVWELWFDEKYKLMRILVEGDNTEVVRD